MTQPPSPKNETEFLDRVRRHHWWNFSVHWTEGLFAMFGLGCLGGTILPAFMLTFTDSKALIALAQNLYFASWTLTQFFYLPLVHRHRMRKMLVVWWGIPIRFTLVILAVTAWLVGSSGHMGPAVGIAGVFVALTLHMIFAGPVELAWMDLISRIVAPERRGFYMGFRHWVEVIAQIGAAWMVGSMIGENPTTADFGWPFMIGAIGFLVTLPIIAATRETPPPEKPAEPRQRYWRSQLATVRTLLNDRPFRRFLGVRAMVGTVAFFGIGMFTPYLHDVFHVTKQTLIVPLNITQVVSGLLAALVAGRLIDRVGCKKVLAGALVASVLARCIALSLPLWGAARPVGFYVLFAVTGIAVAAFLTSSFVITFDFAGVHKRTSYIAMSALLHPPIAVISALAGGLFVDAFGYTPALWIGMAITVGAALLVAFYMPEPRKHMPFERIIVVEEGKI